MITGCSDWGGRLLGHPPVAARQDGPSRSPVPLVGNIYLMIVSMIIFPVPHPGKQHIYYDCDTHKAYGYVREPFIYVLAEFVR